MWTGLYNDYVIGSEKGWLNGLFLRHMMYEVTVFTSLQPHHKLEATEVQLIIKL
jgi:hypothetical protein